MPTPTLDLTYVRSQFPALDQQWTYMDNAGGSQVLKGVADRIHDYLISTSVQHGASYAVSQQAVNRVQEATQVVASLLNAADPQEVVMGPSTTALIRILSLCISQQWKEGDEVIVTNTDHEANVSPWTDLEAKGIKVHIWKANLDTHRLELDDLAPLMNERTQLVAVTHTSNVLGTLNPIRQIADFVHERNALICVDGVAHAPHRLVDVQQNDADFYIFSFYKVYGPHYAVMYGKKQLLLDMPGLNHYFIKRTDLPYKFQPGNVNFELAYGMLGLTDYLQEIARLHFPNETRNTRADFQRAFDLFSRQEEVLGEKFIEYLQTKSRVRIIGEPTADASLRVPTISFVVEGVKSDEIVAFVDSHHIGIRFGDFYAKKLIHDLGLDAQNGVVRVSLVHYNSLDEVNRLISALEESGKL